MTIWKFYSRVMKLLIGWNVINIAAGITAARRENAQTRGIASQAVGWGVINILIGIFGGFATDLRMRKMANPYQPEIMAKETDNFKRILLINTGLDVLYMLGGLQLAQSRGKRSDMMRGIGYGITLQGALLFVFDLVNVLLIPPKPETPEWL
jgi:hypothetical protein